MAAELRDCAASDAEVAAMIEVPQNFLIQKMSRLRSRRLLSVANGDRKRNAAAALKSAPDRQFEDDMEVVSELDPFIVLTLLRQGASMALAEIESLDEASEMDESKDFERIVVLANLVRCYSRLTAADILGQLEAAPESSVVHCPALIYFCVIMVDVAEVMRRVASASAPVSTPKYQNGAEATSGVEIRSGVGRRNKAVVENLDENSATFLFLLEIITAAKTILSKRGESLKRRNRRLGNREPEAGGGDAASAAGARVVDQSVIDMELKAFQTSVTAVIELLVEDKLKETIASLLLAA